MYDEQDKSKFLQITGGRLRQLREQSGISQEKVQFKTGIYLSYVENGHRNITITTLIDLCREYGVTLEEFFAGLDLPAEDAPCPEPPTITDPNDETETL